MVPASEDPILRENRRAELARRLILHGVRTQIVVRLTGLTRSRLTTVRRRLMVGNEARVRGPTRNPMNVFLSSHRARSEGAALVSLLSRFDPPLYERSSPAFGNAAVALGEQLCDVYEAYRACYPRTQVQLEELILFRNLLAKNDVIQLAYCRRCKCLILLARLETRWECSHCKSGS